MSYESLVIVCAVAFVAPLMASVVPRVRIPAVVVEILAGILIGPHGLGWVTIDEPIRVLSALGLSYLLFLSGLQLDITALGGRFLRVTILGFIFSSGLAWLLSLGLHAVGIVQSTLLVAICLTATALGVVAPILREAGEGHSEFGQLVIASSSMAHVGTVLALTLLFSRETTSIATKLFLIGVFVVLIVVVVLAMMGADRWTGLTGLLVRLQDSTSQIRIRGAFLLLVGLVALSARLGIQIILGAFVAGTLLAALDKDYQRTHPRFHEKLDAIGYGIFIPVFFVASGLEFDAGALFSATAAFARVPLFFAALLIVRGVPAALYLPSIGTERSLVAGLLQAISLPFIVTTTTIGVELNILTRSNASALVAAGLLSVVILPMAAAALLKRASAPASS